MFSSFLGLDLGPAPGAPPPRIFAAKDVSNTAQAEMVRDGEVDDQGSVEAFAMLPGALEVAVPEGWQPGEKVPAQGPHGRIMLELPDTVQAGRTIRVPLRPMPDMLVEVPKGASAGTVLTFAHADGAHISMEVPKGKRPGETFEVRPPALMVLVPENVESGSVVIFRAPGQPAGRQVWFQAHVPNILQLGRYFAARMPAPGANGRGRPQKQSTKSPNTNAEEVALLKDSGKGTAEAEFVESEDDCEALAIASEDNYAAGL